MSDNVVMKKNAKKSACQKYARPPDQSPVKYASDMLLFPQKLSAGRVQNMVITSMHKSSQIAEKK